MIEKDEKIRKVRDPANKGRVCYQYGFSGRIFCGADSKERAEQDGEGRRRMKNAKHN